MNVQLTAQGRKYRERIIKARVAADEAIRRQMTREDREKLLGLLKMVAQCEFWPSSRLRRRPNKYAAPCHGSLLRGMGQRCV